MEYASSVWDPSTKENMHANQNILQCSDKHRDKNSFFIPYAKTKHISILSSRVAFGHAIGCLDKPGKPIIQPHLKQ